MKPALARAASAWLEDESAFRAVAARVDRLVELQAALARACPGVPLTVVSLDDDALTLRTPNAAWASRLRQSTPTLLQAIRGHCPQAARIRIVPQRSGDARAAPPRTPRAAIPAPVLAELERLREASDAPVLQHALARLVRRHRAGG